MPSGRGYNINSNNQITARPIDVGMLLGLGFTSVSNENLSPASTLTGTEVVKITQSGINKTTTTQDVADLGGGGGGLSNPFADDTLTTPALYASDTTSGFGFAPATGLPGIAQDGGSFVVEMVDVGGMSQASPAFRVGGPDGSTGGIALLVVSPRSGASEAWVEIDSYGSDSPGLEFVHTGGTKESPTALISGRRAGSIDFMGYAETTVRPGAGIVVRAEEDFTDEFNGSSFHIQTAAVGDPGGISSRILIDGFGNTTITAGGLVIGVLPAAAALDPGLILQKSSYLVAALPAASAGIKGARTFVSDATAPVFGATLTGLGGVFCPVYCDGVAWRCG